MDGFARGELVIMQHATCFEEWDGAIGVVVGILQERDAINMYTNKRERLTGYKVLPLVEGAFEVVCAPWQIRKLGKPRVDRDETATRQVESEDPALTA